MLSSPLERVARARRRALPALCISAAALALPAAAPASPGDRDPAFAGSGAVVVDVPGCTGGLHGHIGYDTGLAPDGDVISLVRTSCSSVSQLSLLRLDADGRPDAGFGSGTGAITSTGGAGHVVVLPSGAGSSHADLAVQPDGKVVVATPRTTGSVTEVLLRRLNGDGTVDTGFGAGGDVVVTTETEQVGDLAFQPAPDGAGRLLLLTNGKMRAFRAADGAIDTTFGNGGSVERLGSFLEVTGDRKLVIKPGFLTETKVVRLLPDGAPDLGFGSAGVATVPSYSALALAPDGKVVTGHPDTSLPREEPGAFIARRFNADGSADTTFGPGGTGTARLSIPGSNNNAWGVHDVLAQPTGHVVVTGQVAHRPSGSSHNTMTAVARLTPEGSTDVTFSSDGVVLEGIGQTVRFSGADHYADSPANLLQRGTRLLVAGKSWTRLNDSGSSGPSFVALDGSILTAPVCVDGDVPDVQYEEPVTFDLGCTDANGDALTLEVLTPPDAAKGTLGTIDQVNRRITFVPATGATGTTSFTFRASDGGLWSEPARITLTILPPPVDGNVKVSRPTPNQRFDHGRPSFEGTASDGAAATVQLKVLRFDGRDFVDHLNVPDVSRQGRDWRYSLTEEQALPDGTYELQARQVDGGGIAHFSSRVRFLVDAPEADPAPVADDKVTITSPGAGNPVLTEAHPLFEGVAGDLGGTPGDESRVLVKLSVLENGTFVPSQELYVDRTGAAWRARPPRPLVDGSYELQVFQNSAKGVTHFSSARRFQVALAQPAPAPPPPPAPAPAASRPTYGVQSVPEARVELPDAHIDEHGNAITCSGTGSNRSCYAAAECDRNNTASYDPRRCEATKQKILDENARQAAGGLAGGVIGSLVDLGGLPKSDTLGDPPRWAFRDGAGKVVAAGLATLVRDAQGNVIAAGAGNIAVDPAFRLVYIRAGSVIANGAGNVVDLAGDVIANGSGNVIAAGAGNVIANGGGNLVFTEDGYVILDDRARVIAAGAGNLIGHAAGNVIANGSGNVIANGSGNLIGHAGGNLIGHAGGNVIANGGLNLIGHAGGNVIQVGNGNVIANGGLNLVSLTASALPTDLSSALPLDVAGVYDSVLTAEPAVRGAGARAAGKKRKRIVLGRSRVKVASPGVRMVTMRLTPAGKRYVKQVAAKNRRLRKARKRPVAVRLAVRTTITPRKGKRRSVERRAKVTIARR